MKLLVSLFVALCVSNVMAAAPLVQYSWHENEKSSFLMIFENGGILHQEKAHYQNKTIPETKLSVEEMNFIKDLILKIGEEKIFSSPIEVGQNMQQGTLMVRSLGKMLVIEGVIKDSIDNSQGIMYHMDARAVAELKKLVFKYTEIDMQF